ncbi:MAG: hypothetical protein HYZ69_03255 [Candidatus Colwellbacteria bacterium]|nr:hypothetical protein [Candidatus Colwellbacteria bacterium]
MKVNRNRAFSNKLLKVLAISGVVAIAATNPFFGVVASHVLREELKRRKWKNFRGDLYYLKRRGFIDVCQNFDGSYSVNATSAGKCQAAKYKLDEIAIKVPKKWDKQWRLIIFDIPIEKQKGRLALLSKLRELRFIMLQKSVWVHPFECRNEVATLAKAFEVDKYIQQLTCSNVSAGEFLKEEFEKRNNIRL